MLPKTNNVGCCSTTLDKSKSHVKQICPNIKFGSPKSRKENPQQHFSHALCKDCNQINIFSASSCGPCCQSLVCGYNNLVSKPQSKEIHNRFWRQCGHHNSVKLSNCIWCFSKLHPHPAVKDMTTTSNNYVKQCGFISFQSQ